MKRLLGLSVFVALALAGNATFAADECAKITATGHPQYPVIAYRDGDNIVGVAPGIFATSGLSSQANAGSPTQPRARLARVMPSWQADR